MRLLLALLFIVYANAQSSTFTATILYSEPSMKGGALNGTMVYDYNASPNPSYFLDFSSQVYSALFQFNTLKGVTSQKAQWVYRYGPGCPGGCETGAIDTWMPKLFIDSSYTNTAVTQTINGVTCTKYVPSTANSLNPVSSLWVTSTQKQCMVQFTNGNQIVFTSVTSYASSSALPASASASFTPKLNCSCGKPIDVSIVIDRSGSISPTEFKQMVSFMNSFINTFKIGPNQTQVALTTFNTKATQLLPLSNNADTVYNAINSMTCSSSAAPSCQTGGTSISAGLQRGADLVAKTATGFRSYATHVIIVLTDGVHNTIADSGSTYCYRPCTESNGDILSYTSCGDSNNNYIPDDWEPSKCSTNCTDFTCKNPTASCSWTGMAQCHRDLINAREYAFNVVGDDLIVFSVGIGPDISVGDLNIITDNRYRFNTSASTATCTNTKTSNAVCINNNYVPCGGKVTTNCYSNEVVYPERVIVNSTFDTLNSKLLELSSRVCDSNAQPCGDCCGYCKCGTCTPPDVCPSSNFCDEPYKSGACCAIRNRTCTPRNPCETAACNRNANAGAGGCEYTPVQCQAADACYSYACNPSKAVTTCDPTFLGQPASDLCHISGCIDGKLVSNQPKVCTPTNPDPCQIYSCNLTSGACYSTPKALPTPPNCFTVSCDSSSTNTSYPFVFSPVVCPSSGDKCQPNLCDASTGKCELNPIDCIADKTNLCDKSKCVDGVCVPEFTTCSTPNCKVNCSCVTSTGVCQCKDKLCSASGCIPQFCNTTTNLCQNETAICPQSCNASNCPSRNNQCYKFKCVDTADQSKINNCDDVTVTTCSNNGDNCLTNCRCDNNTGCVCDPVTCAAPAPCFDLARNSSLGGAQPCCQYTPRVCPTDLCSTTNCSTTTDSCVLYPICPQSDKCFNRGCSPNNGSCFETEIVCVPSDNCQVKLNCDPVLGCSFGPKNCSDNLNCTVDTCDVDGNCHNDPVVCDDHDPCTIDQCDEAASGCTFVARKCDDSNVCTTDTCDKSKTTGDPCVYTPIDVATVCEDNNKCTDDTCDPTDGCKHTYFDPVVSCPTPTDPCSVPICIDTFGCTTRARTCAVNASSGKAIDATYFTDLCDGQGKPISDAANATVVALCKDLKRTNNTDCSYTVCTAAEDGSYYNCTLESRVCDAAISSTVIVAATLGSAVIAGIVIAVIVAVGACGGASYAAYQKLGNDAEAQTHTSPLYVPSAKGGANALYQPEVN